LRPNEACTRSSGCGASILPVLALRATGAFQNLLVEGYVRDAKGPTDVITRVVRLKTSGWRAIVLVTAASAEDVDGAMQRQSIAMLALLLGGDLCLGPSQEAVVVGEPALGAERVNLEGQRARGERRLAVDEHEVQVRGVGVTRVAQLAHDLSLAYPVALCKAQGAWENASRRFSEAAALAREAGSPEVLGYAEARLLELDVLLGRPAGVIARLGPEPDVSDMTWWYDVLLLSVLAEAYTETGDVAGAEETAERALTRARLMNNRVDGVEALRIRAKSLSMQKRREEATAALEEALSWARSMPYPYAEGKILREYGMLHVHERERERARERLSAAPEIFRRLGAEKDAEQTRQTLRTPGQIFD
jgi:tetratricopeptide (TPR) repeat protein